MALVPTIILALIVFLAGASIASFSGLVYYRLKNMDDDTGILETISSPGSHCENCKRELGIVDLIPIVGWLLSTGKCKTCHNKVSITYPIIEAILGSISLAIAWKYFPDVKTILIVLTLTWVLIVIAAIDLSINIIPEELTTPLMFMGILLSPFESDTELKVAGAAFGWFMLHVSMLILQIWKGREGGNGGDAAMGALIGAWFGIFAAPLYLLAFCVFYAIHVGSTQDRRKDGAPCGPAFTAAIIAMMPIHNQIAGLYDKIA